ncbi:MAG: hypothetical protein MOB07_30845 [Acidobacteria bacterium]|nr:hypothetical protein [Acidobacteriota bacterium]
MSGVLHEQISPEILQAIVAQAAARGLSANDYLRNLLGLNEAQGADKKLVSAARTLSLEQRKELIKALFEQFPKPEPLAGSITHIGDLEAATLEIRRKVAESIQSTADQLREAEQ